MLMKKIVIIAQSFNEFHLKNLDLDKLILHFSVTVICYNDFKLEDDKFNDLNICKVKTDDEAIDLLKNFPEKSFIFFAINSKDHEKLFNNIKKLNLIKCSIQYISFMPAIERDFFYDFLIKLFVEKNLIQSFYNFFKKFFFRKKLKPYYDIIFTAGELSKKIKGPLGIKNINTISRNLSNSYRFQKSNINDNYIVYLDCGLGSHPEEKFLNPPSENKIKNFYNELNTFFLKLEKKYNTKVIVAPHPRREYFDHEAFKKRIFNNIQTVDLVRSSKCVVSTHSTSIEYAIIFKKPVILLKSKNFPYFRMYSDIYKWKKNLHCKVINITKSYDLSFNLNYQNFDLFYDQYYLKFICSLDKKNYPKFLWDSFISEYK